MKIIILISLFIFLSPNIYGQENSRSYLYKGHQYNYTYCYSVQKLIIETDSTYIWDGHCLISKKQWKSYKDLKPETSSGKITKKGKYYLLTEYRNGNKTDYNWTVKITDRKIVFYLEGKNGKLKKVTKYKRI